MNSNTLCLSLALDGMVPSQYSGWPFSSFFQMDGHFYATAPDGLYRIGGGDDAGDPILWRVAGPETDLGRDDVKRVRAVSLAGPRLEDVRVAIRYENGSSPAVQQLRPGCFVAGRGGQGGAFQFEVSGEGQAEVTAVGVDVLSLGRRW